MSELLIISLFSISLIGCIASGLPLVLALFVGFFLFLFYGLTRKVALSELLLASWAGIRSTVQIVLILVLIGMFTASWRASGTIAYLVSWAMELFAPEVALLMSFLLTAMLSTITGTSFGTAATMGVVCMAMTNAMGISPVLAGGAILSGIYVGDRCSPVSTSASLVCLVTKTDIYQNVKYMLITGVVPFFIACMLYAGVGFMVHPSAVTLDMASLFSREFTITWITLAPAVVLIGLILLHVNTRITLAASTVVAVVVAYFVQKMTTGDILWMLFSGFTARDAQLGQLVDGGGVVSMISVCLLVVVSSTYSGIFRKTGLLERVKAKIPGLAKRLTPFGVIVLTSLIVSMILGNQLLAVMITKDVCSDIEPDSQQMANALENSAVIIPALIPWAIASAVPLATLKVPSACVFMAWFLMLVPLWGIVTKNRTQWFGRSFAGKR